MGHKVILATCSLNQWAMDFAGNLDRIKKSIYEAKAQGARYRLGPELEIPGYNCSDHYFESDTVLHSWEVLANLLQDPKCNDILCDLGMPVMHKDVLYNCRTTILNGKIVLIRPKRANCDDGNYSETRWFCSWSKDCVVEDHYLPRFIAHITGQRTVPFGDGVIATYETCIGSETCEELWTPLSSHIHHGLDGVEIITNASGSHHELRKLRTLYTLIESATMKSGGVYLYSNLRGCDGERVFYFGGACIAMNGEILSQGKMFDIAEVEVVTCAIDLEDVRTCRNKKRSRSDAATRAQAHPRVTVDFSLGVASDVTMQTTRNIKPRFYSGEEEISLGPAAWLWDYLRRSKFHGFCLPLSGGVDSVSVACIVHSMCTLVLESVKNGDRQTLKDLKRVLNGDDDVPETPEHLCGKILYTFYLATENSSEQTKDHADELTKRIGATHRNVEIDMAVETMLKIFTSVPGFPRPRFTVHGGEEYEDLALQNVQARLRMVLSYFFAQLTLGAKGNSTGLLVLGTANMDESLRGYFTKYGCASADINPVGGITETDLRRFLRYYGKEILQTDILCTLVDELPSAELEPLENGKVVQTDEADMGMTYEELLRFGKLRKNGSCGPYSMFCKLVHEWADKCSSTETAEKVKHFFRTYSENRHKMTTLTPFYHAEAHSADDNRYDHRQFLYNTDWTWQFAAIDAKIPELEDAHRKQKLGAGQENDPAHRDESKSGLNVSCQ